jgi:predicted nucleotidyltransferase
VSPVANPSSEVSFEKWHESRSDFFLPFLILTDLFSVRVEEADLSSIFHDHLSLKAFMSAKNNKDKC